MSDTQRQLGGRYEVGELLGRGGMAEVHRGYDQRLGRGVAIKLLRTDLARDPSFQARFRREAQSAASLNHPAVVAVYDTGEERVDGVDDHTLPYIVMEYVDGTTLRDLLDDGRRLLPERALEITAGVLDALDYSHRAGIVHRDIKPANVMLTRTGDIKVMDFGIARAVADTAATMTQTSAVIGTAQYLSPEQARGETVDARSDIYSTGCLLYELLTGRPPFVGDSPVSVAYQHVREQPQPPSALDPEIPPEVDAIVMKSLVKDRNQRYQTAAEMRDDISRALAGRPVSAPAVAEAPTQAMGAVAAPTQAMAAAGATTTLPGGTGEQPAQQERDRRWAYLLLGLAVLAVFLLAAFLGTKLLGGGGGTQVAMTKVVGLTEDQARAALARDGFKNIQTTQKADDLPKGTVLEQQPTAGTRVDPASTAVSLVVSSGPSTATVPKLVGLSLDEAQRALADAKLAVGNVDRRNSDQDADTVLDASAQEGDSVPVGQKIDLVVANGNNSVPNVIGATEDDARKTLEDAGFKVRTITQYDDANPAGSVIDQTPSSDQSRPIGSAVTITVAKQRPSQPSSQPTTTAPPTTSAPPTTTPPPSGGGGITIPGPSGG